MCAGCAQVLGIEDPGGSTNTGDGGVKPLDGANGGDANPGVCAPVPAFGGVMNFSAAGASDIAVGDLDGNGTKDVLVAVGTDVLLFKGDGAGHLSGGASLTGTPLVATGVVAADVDGDGLDDVVTWSRGSSSVPGSKDVTIRRQDAANHGTFLAPQTFTTTSIVVAAIAADLDNDHHVDLVVGNSQSITVYRASTVTPGTFDVGPIAVAPIQNPVGVIDIDGDGFADIAFSDQSGVHVRYNQPATPGMFDPAATIGTVANGAVFGHFSANPARRDLVIFGTGGGMSSLFTQTTPRTFVETSASAINLGGQMSTGLPGIVAADINDDGKDDVITVGQMALQCSAIAGQFYPASAGQAPLPLGVVAQPNDVQLLADLNADDKLDLLQLATGGASGGGAQFLQVSIHQ